MNVYEWKLPGVIPVDAQTAGEEFARIYEKNGRLDAENVVVESRPESAPLHACFEWNDMVAAEEYRKSQAMTMIRMITVKAPVKGSQESVPVRAYINTKESAYLPLTVVLESPELREELLNTALQELKAFQKKYATLKLLEPVFEAIKLVEEAV